jgi:hypothetical protein
MTSLKLTDEEQRVLLVELRHICGEPRYPFSPRIRTLRAILAKLETPEPEPAPEPPQRHYEPSSRRPATARRARSNTILAAIAVAALIASLPVRAEPGHPVSLGVYDARGAFVCTYDHDDTCYRQYNGKWYTLGFDTAGNEAYDGPSNGGLQVNALWVFTSNNCSGAAWDYYFWEGRAPVPIARFDGVNVWASDPDTQQLIAANSYMVVGWDYVYGPGYPAGCIPYSWNALVTVPKLIDGAPGWVPPFSVRAQGGE